eukprot:15472419-Alexandrium_andersonii.AAC.1
MTGICWPGSPRRRLARTSSQRVHSWHSVGDTACPWAWPARWAQRWCTSRATTAAAGQSWSGRWRPRRRFSLS